MTTTTSTAPGYPLDDWALEAAINAGNAQWVAQVIAAGVDLSRRTTEPSGRCLHPGTTSLGLAIGNVEIVRMLLDAGAPVNQVAVRWGGTALHMAVVQSIGDGTIELLLKAGADPLLTDAKGRRPIDYLSWAVAKHLSDGDKELVRVATKFAIDTAKANGQKRPKHRQRR
ncbi:ankyrin repeat domain-containing protein [Burkholderia gladioli]|uniref:ankyrin repeat domain-containing protein n=1 Tax=Burkholderia gladioli TaxID=28095 RepID=UPI001640975F|nr:ankyrin repeat domain-containing protein [Burkholderia gladioli]